MRSTGYWVAMIVVGIFVWTLVAKEIRRWWKDRQSITPRDRQLRDSPQIMARNRKQKIIFAVIVILVAAALSVHIFGSDEIKSLASAMQEAIGSFMRYMVFVAIGLLGIYVLIVWLRRDRHVIRAAKLALEGKYDEAIAEMNTAIETKGPNVERLNALGLLLMDQKRMTESLEQFDRSEKLFGMNAGTSNNRAVLLHRMGRLEEALLAFAKVTELYPKEFMSHCNYASLLADMGRTTEAYEQLTKAEMIAAQYDTRYVPAEWKNALAECRSKLPLSQGFEVLPKKPA